MSSIILDEVAPAPLSPLEQQLMDAQAQNLRADVTQLDVLKDVLLRLTGTAAQRNTLLRIIKANRTGPRIIGQRLANHLNEGFDTQTSNVGDSYSALARALEPDEDDNEEGPQT